jgi:electron transfer flavoprotein alpha subunit
MAAVGGAGTILAINSDSAAPIFAAADIGIVAPWREAVPALVVALQNHSVGSDLGPYGVGHYR